MEIRTIQPFLHYFGNVRERTMRVARCIPPDKLDWSYAPGKFTLGDLLRHIAVAERFVWAEALQGHKSRYTTHGKELADGYENVIRFKGSCTRGPWRFSRNSAMKICSANARRLTTRKSKNGNGCA
jgi:uncharacterized damage-inducible protein DinB